MTKRILSLLICGLCIATPSQAERVNDARNNNVQPDFDVTVDSSAGSVAITACGLASGTPVTSVSASKGPDFSAALETTPWKREPQGPAIWTVLVDVSGVYTKNYAKGVAAQFEHAESILRQAKLGDNDEVELLLIARQYISVAKSTGKADRDEKIFSVLTRMKQDARQKHTNEAATKDFCQCSMLTSGLLQVVDKLSREQGRRKVLLFLSDGKDEAPAGTTTAAEDQKNLGEKIKQAGIKLINVGCYTTSEHVREGSSYMTTLATRSNGLCLFSYCYGQNPNTLTLSNAATGNNTAALDRICAFAAPALGSTAINGAMGTDSDIRLKLTDSQGSTGYIFLPKEFLADHAPRQNTSAVVKDAAKEAGSTAAELKEKLVAFGGMQPTDESYRQTLTDAHTLLLKLMQTITSMRTSQPDTAALGAALDAFMQEPDALPDAQKQILEALKNLITAQQAPTKPQLLAALGRQEDLPPVPETTNPAVDAALSKLTTEGGALYRTVDNFRAPGNAITQSQLAKAQEQLQAVTAAFGELFAAGTREEILAQVDAFSRSTRAELTADATQFFMKALDLLRAETPPTEQAILEALGCVGGKLPRARERAVLLWGGLGGGMVLLVLLTLLGLRMRRKTTARNAKCVLYDTASGKEWYISTNCVTIGRSPKSDICIKDPSVSSCHCSITLQENGEWQLRDAGSTNQIYYNNQVCDVVDLVNGSVFELGSVKLRFNIINHSNTNK